MSATLRSRPFGAMGTRCLVAVTAGGPDAAGADAALDAAVAEISACERALSRFDPASDLSRLNEGAGSWVPVGERLIAALGAAVDARRDTEGRYDPTILPALAAAGYDRSFDSLTDAPPGHLAGWRAGGGIEIDVAEGRARIDRDAAVDLGGIGKGFSAGRALEAMRRAWPGAAGALVDLGGDVALDGEPPGGGPWRVDIADPRRPGAIVGTLRLGGGGVATSGRDTRRFGRGRRRHHLIDPLTGDSAVAGPLAVTVVAPTATEAEAHATALAITDPREAPARLAAFPGIAALLINGFGEPIEVGLLPLDRGRMPPALAITTQAGRISWR